MARPTKVEVESGIEGWDEEFNENLVTLFETPYPAPRYPSDWATTKTIAQLETAYPAAQYEECIIFLKHAGVGAILMISNGTKWVPVQKALVESAASAAGAVAVDADALGHGGTLRTSLTENITYGAPSGGFDGQIITLEPKQHATTGPYTVAFNAIYRFSTTVPAPTMTPTASKRDAYMFKYHAGDNKWDAYACNQAI